MGGTSSKIPAKFPKLPKTPSGQVSPRAPSVHPTGLRAAEVKNEDIRLDGADPHLLANLRKLGPVAVDHHMQTIKTQAQTIGKGFEAWTRSEDEVASGQLSRNHLRESRLSNFFKEYNKASDPAQLESIAKSYNMDLTVASNLVQYVTTPTIDTASSTSAVQKEGTTCLDLSCCLVHKDKI
ncbi:hypothetical protein DL96DRAFT_1577500, partial [Flagelloscypha sp. PMI_526]